MTWQRTKRGFTLIEVMVVVSLIAILSAIAVPAMIAYRRTAHAKACMDNIHLIRSACRAYEIKNGKLTDDLDELVGSNGQGFLRWKPVCPVGGEYKLTIDEKSDSLTIICTKADAEEHNVTE